MSDNSTIEWTDTTWNPVRGCAMVSDGCRHCYAMKQAHRFSGAGQPYDGLTELGPNGPRWTGHVRLVPELLAKPLQWRKPRRVFVNSMSDLFHEDVPDDFIDRVFAVMALARRHTFQILTKRPSRMQLYLSEAQRRERVRSAGERMRPSRPPQHWYYVSDWSARLSPWPLPNVWLGVSCENQATADARIPLLLQTPSAVRFVSAEPLLGGLDIAKHRPGANRLWVIVGGESGPGARPCEVWWIENIVRQCQCADVPVFVKQLGSSPRWVDCSVSPIAPARGKGNDMREWPESLRVRQFPQVTA